MPTDAETRVTMMTKHQLRIKIAEYTNQLELMNHDYDYYYAIAVSLGTYEVAKFTKFQDRIDEVQDLYDAAVAELAALEA